MIVSKMDEENENPLVNVLSNVGLANVASSIIITGEPTALLILLYKTNIETVLIQKIEIKIFIY